MFETVTSLPTARPGFGRRGRPGPQGPGQSLGVHAPQGLARIADNDLAAGLAPAEHIRLRDLQLHVLPVPIDQQPILVSRLCAREQRGPQLGVVTRGFDSRPRPFAGTPPEGWTGRDRGR